jgi:hypothetical protein
MARTGRPAIEMRDWRVFFNAKGDVSHVVDYLESVCEWMVDVGEPDAAGWAVVTVDGVRAERDDSACALVVHAVSCAGG